MRRRQASKQGMSGAEISLKLQKRMRYGYYSRNLYLYLEIYLFHGTEIRMNALFGWPDLISRSDLQLLALVPHVLRGNNIKVQVSRVWTEEKVSINLTR